MPVPSSSKLERKHILLDTCFIIKAYDYAEMTFFDDLFRILQENQCVPIINEFIRFEFLRRCKIPKHIKDKSAFLDILSGMTLPATAEVFSDAITISNIYSHNNIQNNQISLVDCLISSYLKKYKDNLFLLTLNYCDFPTIIHDRIKVITIDTDKELLLLTFIRFNTEKYNKALENFHKAQ